MAGKADIEAGRAFVRLYLKNDMSRKLVRALRSAQYKLRNFGRSAMAAGRQLAMAGAAATAPLAFATRTFVGFEDQMLTVKAVTGAVGDEFDKLTAKAKLLGRTTSYTAAEVAGGMVELGRAGFKPTEIDASIASILSLARATGTELPKAAEIAAGTLRAFSLDASEMNRVTDVMVATANNSAQTLEQLGDSMTYVAPIAEEFGLTLEETNKALGVMANMQIKGSMAGTSMRMMLLQLSDPAIRKQLQGMGVDLGNFGDTMLGVGRVMADMSGPERLAFAKQIFGQRAAGGALKLTKGGFDDLSNAIDNAAGSAAKAAAEMDSGLGGVFRILKSALEGVQIAIGETYGDALKRAGRNITKIFGTLTAWVKQNKKLVVTFAKVAGGLIVAGGAIMTFGFAVSALGSAAGLLASGPLGLLTIGVGALAVAYANATVEGITFGQSVLDLTHKITGLTNAYSRLSDAEQRARNQQMAEGGAARDVREEKGADYIGSAEDIETQYSALRKIDAELSRNEALRERLLKGRRTVTDAFGRKRLENARFLPQAARKLLDAESRIKQLKVRRRDTRRAIAEAEKLAGDDKQLSAQFKALAETERKILATNRALDKLFRQQVTNKKGGIYRTGDKTRATEAGIRDATAQGKQLQKTRDQILRGIDESRKRLATVVTTRNVFQEMLTGARDVGAKVGALFAAGFNKAIKSAAATGTELQRVQAEGIEGPQRRELALTNLDFDKRTTEAKNRGESTIGIELIREQTIANIKARFARKQADADKWTAELRADAEQRLNEQVARAKINATMKGAEKAKALLALERSEALDRAKADGTDLAKVNELFDLRKSMIGRGGAGSRSAVAFTATYSAAAASISGYQPAAAGPEEKMASGIAASAENSKQMLVKMGEWLEQNKTIQSLYEQFLAGWKVT